MTFWQQATSQKSHLRNRTAIKKWGMSVDCVPNLMPMNSVPWNLASKGTMVIAFGWIWKPKNWKKMTLSARNTTWQVEIMECSIWLASWCKNPGCMNNLTKCSQTLKSTGLRLTTKRTSKTKYTKSTRRRRKRRRNHRTCWKEVALLTLYVRTTNLQCIAIVWTEGVEIWCNANAVSNGTIRNV